MRWDQTIIVSLAGASLALGVAGCSDGADDVAARGQTVDTATDVSATTELPPGPDLRRFVDALTVGYSVGRSSTPAEYAEQSELIIRGTLQAVRTGRTVRYFEGSASHTVILDVTPTEILRGALPADSDGTVYLEVVVRGRERIDELMATLPVGANVQAYLVPARTAESEPRLVDPDAGRPAGQPLWDVLLGAGFVLWNEQGLFVPEYDGWSGRGLTADDFAPDRTVNPQFVDGTVADTTIDGGPTPTGSPPTAAG